MSRAPNPTRRSPRVYYIIFACALVFSAADARAQVELTVAPFMAKGPADAPVTIVDFSDYQ